MSALVAVVGQSNAVGFNVHFSDLPVATQSYFATLDPLIKIWNAGTGAWQTMNPGVNTGGVNAGASYAVGPEVQFAMEWRIAHPGETLYIVKVAQGSTGLAQDGAETDWSPNSSNELFAKVTLDITNAKNALSDAPQLSTVIWVQGEQDATNQTKADNYGSNEDAFFDAVRNTWGNQGTMILDAQLNSNIGMTYKATVQAGKVTNDQGDNNAHLLMTDSFSLQSDSLHYNGVGQSQLGAGFYSLYNTRIDTNGSTASEVLYGRGAQDHIWSGDGNDTIYGGDAFDDLHGNKGDDLVDGGSGDDWVVGGQGTDMLIGRDGNDLMYGNMGVDTMFGDTGNDTMRGGQENDTITGASGNDWIYGDKGNDTISLGNGSDFVFVTGDMGADRVLDFDITQGDKIKFETAQGYTVTTAGSDTIVNLSDGGSITLVGVTLTLGDWIG